MYKQTWKSILLVAALAAGSLVTFAESADAAKKTCIQRYRECNQRCAGAAGPNGDWTACISRTCNRQYDNCVAG
jgi:hypothetical protein